MLLCLFPLRPLLLIWWVATCRCLLNCLSNRPLDNNPIEYLFPFRSGLLALGCVCRSLNFEGHCCICKCYVFCNLSVSVYVSLCVCVCVCVFTLEFLSAPLYSIAHSLISLQYFNYLHIDGHFVNYVLFIGWLPLTDSTDVNCTPLYIAMLHLAGHY